MFTDIANALEPYIKSHPNPDDDIGVQQLREALENVEAERKCDHDIDHLIPELRNRFGPGFDIKTSIFGYDINDQPRIGLDYWATMKANEKRIPNVDLLMLQAVANFYAGDETARKHRTVMDKIAIALHKIGGVSCST